MNKGAFDTLAFSTCIEYRLGYYVPVAQDIGDTTLEVLC